MRRAVALLFTIMMLAAPALCRDTLRQSEFVKLITERSRLIESLAEQPPPDVAAALQERLNRIEEKIRDMGIELPAPPAPLASEADRTDLPIPRPASPSIEGRRYRFDASVSPSFNDNYFQAVAGTSPQSAWLTNISGSFQFALVRRGRSQLTAGVDVQRNNVEGIELADWNTYGARLAYSTGRNQLTFQGVYIPRRLTFITREGNPGLATTTALGSDYSRRLTGRARARLFYRWNRVRYPGFDNRDLLSHMAAGDAQYQFHTLFIPGVGIEWTDARGSLENYSYVERTPVLLLGARFGRAATLNVRYRYRERTYPLDDVQASNFGRKDRRHDAYAYLSIGLGGHLNLTVYGNYLRNRSTRAYRAFKTLNGGITLRYTVPGS